AGGRGGGVRPGATCRELPAHALSRGRAHRPAPARGDLRADGLWPVVRFRRRAGCAAGERGAAGRAARSTGGLAHQPRVPGRRIYRAERGPRHTMKQPVLDIRPDAPPTLENFVAGTNTELVATVSLLASPTTAAQLPARHIYLWGGAGSGRSHLLRAT